MFKQKEAAFNAITKFAEYSGQGPYTLSKSQREQVIDSLVSGFQAGQIEMGNQEILADEKALREYTSGLVSNWLRKDTRLNGGVKYTPKNPGSRVSDPTLKAMRELRSTLTDAADIAEVDAHIAARQAEIAKSKAPVIDFSVLPESLVSKFGN